MLTCKLTGELAGRKASLQEGRPAGKGADEQRDKQVVNTGRQKYRKAWREIQTSREGGMQIGEMGEMKSRHP